MAWKLGGESGNSECDSCVLGGWVQACRPDGKGSFKPERRCQGSPLTSRSLWSVSAKEFHKQGQAQGGKLTF